MSNELKEKRPDEYECYNDCAVGKDGEPPYCRTNDRSASPSVYAPNVACSRRLAHAGLSARGIQDISTGIAARRQPHWMSDRFVRQLLERESPEFRIDKNEFWRNEGAGQFHRVFIGRTPTVD